MKKSLVIHSIPSFKGWETCFRSLIEKCDNFTIIFQGNEKTPATGELNAGKEEFLNVPFIFISPYKGMENSIEVAGELNKAAQELFLHFLTPSFQGQKSDLWSFQLLTGKEVMLRVEDFSVALLFLEEDELAYLSSQGVDTQDMVEVDFDQGERQSDIEVVSWSKDELSSLADALRTAFPVDHEKSSQPSENDL